MNQERTTAKTRAQSVASKPIPARTARKAAAPVEPEWNEVANFVLTFESRTPARGARENRITAHKMQDGGLTAEWRGTEQQTMCGWISQHLGDWPAASDDDVVGTGELPTPSADRASSSRETNEPTEVRPAAPSPEALPAFRLQVTALYPLARGSADARVHAVGTLPFDLEASIIAEPLNPDAALEFPVPCEVEFFCRNTTTTEKLQLGSIVVDMTRAESAHKAVLRQVSLAPGHYRLACIARLRRVISPVACLQGPPLQVG